jgi:hypothetical protein
VSPEYGLLTVPVPNARTRSRVPVLEGGLQTVVAGIVALHHAPDRWLPPSVSHRQRQTAFTGRFVGVGRCWAWSREPSACARPGLIDDEALVLVGAVHHLDVDAALPATASTCGPVEAPSTHVF